MITDEGNDGVGKFTKIRPELLLAVSFFEPE